MLTRLLAVLALGAALIACTPAGGSSPAATVQPSVAAPSAAAPSVAAPSAAAPSDVAPTDAAPSIPAESASPSAS